MVYRDGGLYFMCYLWFAYTNEMGVCLILLLITNLKTIIMSKTLKIILLIIALVLNILCIIYNEAVFDFNSLVIGALVYAIIIIGSEDD